MGLFSSLSLGISLADRSIAALTNKQVTLGEHGAKEIHPLGSLNDFEKAGLEALKKELADSIKKGVDFVHQS